MNAAVIPESVIRDLLREAGPKLVLVGGQALAYWMRYYHVPFPSSFITVSSDIDFLTASATH